MTEAPKKGLYAQMTHATGQTVAISHPDPDLGFEEMLSNLRAFMIACGYLESQVNEVFGDI